MFSMSSDKRYFTRTIYSGLDFLGDIGGLAGILYSMGQAMLGLLSGNGLMQFLSTELFRVESQDKSKRFLRKSLN